MKENLVNRGNGMTGNRKSQEINIKPHGGHLSFCPLAYTKMTERAEPINNIQVAMARH